MPRISLSTIATSQSFQSYHFTTALIELFDRLIELLYRERHVEDVRGSARLTIDMFPKSTKVSPPHFLWTSVRCYRTRRCSSWSVLRLWLVGVGVVVFRSCIWELEAQKLGRYRRCNYPATIGIELESRCLRRCESLKCRSVAGKVGVKSRSTREGISKAAGSSDVPLIGRAGHPNSRLKAAKPLASCLCTLYLHCIC